MSLLGTKVGKFRIVDELGRGGMGEVYAALDEKLDRRVALKVIRSERRLDAEAQARLLREARILSQLDHPHICRIHEYLEGEELDFLVLELIPGRSLRRAIADGMPAAQRLRIAEQIVSALVAAHGQGVIHRDLKPDNVMVTPGGEVKVLDFGVARSTVEELPATIAGGGTLEDTTTTVALRTRAGALVGTLSSMSPEQMRGEPATAASDMYACGLLLQELFTGRPAYPAALPPRVLLERVERGETEPVTGAPAEVRALIERLKSPLPSARPSAVETADRLRWVREAPRRRRRRWAVAGAMAALAVVAVAMAVQAQRVAREAERANREAARANQEAETAREVSRFLVGLFQVSDPGESRGATVTAREILDRGAARVDQELRQQPVTQARLQDTIGVVYRQLGLFRDARPLLEAAAATRERLLGPEHPDTAESWTNLGYLHWRLGQLAESEAFYRKAIAAREKSLGPDHPDLATSMNGLAIALWNQGRYDEAEPLYRRSLEIRERALGPEHKDVASSLDNLAILYKDQGRAADAEPLYRRSLAIRERLLGADHPDVATSLNNLAELYRGQKRDVEAEPLYRRALAIWEKALGPEHTAVSVALTNLAGSCSAQKRYAEAEALYERALGIMERSVGPDHPYVAYCLDGLGDLYQDRGQPGDPERAVAAYRRSLAVFEKSMGPDHPDAGRGWLDLGRAYQRLGREAEARAALERALVVLAALPGAGDDPELAALRRELARGPGAR